MGIIRFFSRRLLRVYSAYQVTGVVVTLSAALFTADGAADQAACGLGATPREAWLSVGFFGVFAMCVGNFLWVWGVGKIGSARDVLYNKFFAGLSPWLRGIGSSARIFGRCRQPGRR
jgi:drug/metabolite transporter (DMT)-like permease